MPAGSIRLTVAFAVVALVVAGALLARRAGEKETRPGAASRPPAQAKPTAPEAPPEEPVAGLPKEHARGPVADAELFAGDPLARRAEDEPNPWATVDLRSEER